MTKNQIKAVVGSIIASGTDDLNVMFLSFAMSGIMSEFMLSGAQSGLIATLTNLGMLVGGMLFGILGDRHNKMTILKITLLIFCLASGGIAFAPNITTIYILRFIAGIGVGGEYGIALSIMANIVPLQKMGTVSSWNGVAGQVGSIGSAILAGLFVPSLGWRGLFLFGLAPLVLVLYLHFAIDDEATFHPEPQLATGNSHLLTAFKALFANAKVGYQSVTLMLMTTVQIAGYFGMMNWLPTIMQQQTGASVTNSSIWMVSTIVGMSIGMLVFGRLLDRVGPRIMFGTFLIASAITVFLFSTLESNWSMLIGGTIMGFFVNGMFPGYGAVVSRIYDKSIQATANNIILNVGRAVGGFSSVIIGFIMEKSGVPTVMLFLSILYLTSFVVMLTIPALKRRNFTAFLNQ